MDNLYPGLKELIQENGLSVQAQDSYPLRTSVDQRGEQTINRHAKTSDKNLLLLNRTLRRRCDLLK